MKKKHHYRLCFIFFMIFFFQLGAINGSAGNEPNEFKFYNIGVKDTKDTAEEKLNAIGFQCLQGKAMFLDIKKVQKQGISKITTEKIEELITIDNIFKDYGQGIDPKGLSMSVLGCLPPEDSPFAFSKFYFSEFDQKLLSIGIMIKQFDLVKEKMNLKFGPCLSKGYCESDNSILILAQFNELHLKIYFYESLKSHYEEIKKLLEFKNKKIVEKIDEAF